jgi:3-oxoacyl-[acyl-carrier-protein] synthase-1
MVTAVGQDGPNTCAALRAGMSGMRAANLWDPTAGQYLSAGRPVLHQWSEGPATVATLTTLAVRACLESHTRATGRTVGKVLVIVLLSPVQRAHRWPDLNNVVLSALAAQFTLANGSGAFSIGSTGIIPALEVAAKALEQDAEMPCVIVGAESFLRQAIVKHYIDAGRLLCGANSNGFIPGEAACAVLVARSGYWHVPELALEGVGLAMDPSGAGGNAQHPSTGNGLTDAIRQALTEAAIPFYAVNFSISDLNGERFKFKEATIAQARLDRPPPAGVPPRPAGHLDVWHPIEFLGEIGSAIFPCILGWAYEAGLKGYAAGEAALLHASEEDGARAAMVARFRTRKD